MDKPDNHPSRFEEYISDQVHDIINNGYNGLNEAQLTEVLNQESFVDRVWGKNNQHGISIELVQNCNNEAGPVDIRMTSVDSFGVATQHHLSTDLLPGNAGVGLIGDINRLVSAVATSKSTGTVVYCANPNRANSSPKSYPLPTSVRVTPLLNNTNVLDTGEW